MHILLTGATGFVGKNLAKHLLNRNHELTLLIRRDSQLDSKLSENCKVITYQNNDPDRLLNELKASPPEVIAHLATEFKSKHFLSDMASMITANVTLGSELAEIGKELKIERFINTTTYATSISGKLYDPQNFYSSTKKAFEDILYYYAANKSFKVCNITLHDTYGPRDTRSKFINLILESASKNEVLNMSQGEQEISYIHIDDVSNGLESTLTIDLDKYWNQYSLHSEEVYKLIELVDVVGDVLGKKIITNPGHYPYRDREIMKFQPKFPLVPGFKAKINISDGIQSIIKEG